MNGPAAGHSRGLRERLALLPFWAGLAIGVPIIALGLWLMARPLSSTNLLVIVIGLSLILSGGGELVQSRAAWPSLVGAAVLVAAGVLVLALRGMATDLLPIVIAVTLIAFGVLRIVGAIRREAEDRATSLVIATAGILAGVIALAWPDVTLLVAAVAFGVWTVVFGAQLVWSTIAPHGPGRAGGDIGPPRSGPFAQWARLLARSPCC